MKVTMETTVEVEAPAFVVISGREIPLQQDCPEYDPEMNWYELVGVSVDGDEDSSYLYAYDEETDSIILAECFVTIDGDIWVETWKEGRQIDAKHIDSRHLKDYFEDMARRLSS